MVTGTLTFDLRLGDCRTLKDKRSTVRPLVAELRRRFQVAAAEVGCQDLTGRAVVGVAVVADVPRHVGEVLDACERFVAERVDIELLSVHRRLIGDEDE